MNRGKKARAYQKARPELMEGYESRRAHSIQRMKERYGLDMSIKEYEVLCNQMPSAKTEERYLARRSPHGSERGNVRFYAVFWKSELRWVLAAYSFRSFQIVTFLSPEHLPQDLPDAATVVAQLERGASVENLRGVLSADPRPAFSLEGEINWAILDMEPMGDIAEAKASLKMIGCRIHSVNEQLGQRELRREIMAADEYKSWLNRALWAVMWMRNQRKAIECYIALMNQRARRLEGGTDAESLLARLMIQFDEMRDGGRAQPTPDDYAVFDAASQYLIDAGWQFEQLTTPGRYAKATLSRPKRERKEKAT